MSRAIRYVVGWLVGLGLWLAIVVLDFDWFAGMMWALFEAQGVACDIKPP